MDIIDIILAKALTPQEAISTYAERARRAAADATAAAAVVENAADIVTNIEGAIHDEVDKVLFELLTISDTGVIQNNLQITYPSEQESIVQNINKYYTTTGNNEDGTMTQKAISTELTDLADRVTYLEEHGGGSAPSVTNDIVGLKINYSTKTFTPLEKSVQLSPGNAYDYLPMYGGRLRCNVANDGTINAFYGDNNYAEDGSNGQVMVYQPKFYYKRTPLSMNGNNVIEETILLSATHQTGFKLHPLFYDNNGNELEYVLISAYEGSVYDTSNGTYITNANANIIDNNADKLSSIGGVKPQADITITNFETLANNRGNNWHIANLLTFSANQLLFLVEYSALNSQTALAPGIAKIVRFEQENFSSNTGSTMNLGNRSGRAMTTTNNTNNVTTNYTTNDTCAISYRGVENLWGNIWCFVGGLYSKKVNSNQEELYLCPNYNYNNLNNYITLPVTISNTSNWGASLIYVSETYDWILIPYANDSGNSEFPIGDYVWMADNNDNHSCLLGGSGNHEDLVGLFNYAFDQNYTEVRNVRNARLIHIPATSSSNYLTNQNNWQQRVML